MGSYYLPVSSSVATLLDLATRPEFLTGLAAGLVGLVVLALRPTSVENKSGWAITVAVATTFAILFSLDEAVEIAMPLAALAIGGWLLDRYKSGKAVAWAVIATGAVALAWTGIPSESGLLRPMVSVVTILAGWSLSGWVGFTQRNWLGPIALVSAFGIWATVPETEIARVLLGVLVLLSFATLSWIGAVPSTAGAFALGGLVAWVPAIGGLARPGSIVGGWACLGMIALIPALQKLGLYEAPIPTRWLLFGHVMFVLIASRVIGFWESAALAALGALLLGFIAALGIVRLSRTSA